MSNSGYLVDEATATRIAESMLALRCIQALVAEAKEAVPTNELYSLLAIIGRHGQFDIESAPSGRWKKEESHAK